MCDVPPRDPADCARGEIVFDDKRWSVSLPCCKRAHEYAVVSATTAKVTISSGGDTSEIRLDADGTAHWSPGGLGGRVGELSFVRAKK